MPVFFRDPSRNDSGDNLLGLVIAMFVFALLVPGLLVLLTRSQQLATASPDWDEGVAARAELAEMFGSVDPVGQCASPSGGRDAAYSGSCFREERYAGASLVMAPVLPAASPPVACWLTTSDTGTRHRRCIVLEGDSDVPECVNPNGPCLRVVSTATGTTGEKLVNVDRYGGGRLLVRSWAEIDSDSDPDTVPFLPHEWTEPPTDRLIYQDVEWWCMKWRSPDGSGSVTNWTGECPAPDDPAEWHDPSDAATWPQSSPQPVPALPNAAAPGSADGSGTLTGPHTPGNRITDVEVLVCVASTYADRLQGASHCTVDTMRFSVADTDGATPPTPGFVPDSSVTNSGGVEVTESGAAESFGIRLATAPTAPVTITVALTPPLAGVTVTPDMLTFTAANWRTPQTVTVDASGHDDLDAIDETATITLTAASTDSNYNGPIPPDIAVTVTDNDKPALIANTDSVTVTEGSTADIAVQLQTAPAVAVTVAATSDDTAAATVTPASLTFAAGTGLTPQTLTITGVDDADTADATATVTLTATSIGAGYNGLTESIAVSVTDDD